MHTASNIDTDGTLTVDGASTLTGAITASSTLGLAGAATLASTLAVTGASTLTGAVTGAGAMTVSGEGRFGSYFGVGSAAIMASPDDYATTYSWMYCDGTNVKLPALMLYDTTTEAYRVVYLDGGTLTIV